MAITLEEAYEIIRRHRPDMRFHRDHVCKVQDNSDPHELAACPCEHDAVYQTSDALSVVQAFSCDELRTGNTAQAPRYIREVYPFVAPDSLQRASPASASG